MDGCESVSRQNFLSARAFPFGQNQQHVSLRTHRAHSTALRRVVIAPLECDRRQKNCFAFQYNPVEPKKASIFFASTLWLRQKVQSILIVPASIRKRTSDEKHTQKGAESYGEIGEKSAQRGE